MEWLIMLAATILFPPLLLFGFFVVHPREELVILRFGKYVKTVSAPGIYWMHPVGRDIRRIPTQDISLHIPTSTVVERHGNPILISAVIVYRVEDTRKAALDVENFRQFIGDQAGAVIKRTSAHFPYDSPDHSEPCLRVESEVVTAAYLQELQAAVAPAGIHVLLIRLNDLTYAPEIAPAMLMRQQALALVDARKTIVEGAVELVKDAVERLRATGLDVGAAEKQALISNLLLVLCSGDRPHPVMQIQSEPRREA
jgi:regulator of protease activity HflC (stomatin/prohibitin superfamily)